MESMVIIDWKFVVALGAVAVGVIFAVKMDASAAKECQSMRLIPPKSTQSQKAVVETL